MTPQKAEEHEREQHRTFNPITAAQDLQRKAAQSAKPLKRIVIEEFGSSASEDEEGDAQSPKTKPSAAAATTQTPKQLTAELPKPRLPSKVFAPGQIKSSLQFESAWKDARGDVRVQAQLLQARRENHQGLVLIFAEPGAFDRKQRSQDTARCQTAAPNH